MNFDERTSISDLTWNLVPYYGAKAERRTLSDIRRYDRFTISSRVSQKNFLIIEKFFQDYLNDVDFVELSPLQPLGVNCVLAKTNGKKLFQPFAAKKLSLMLLPPYS